MTRSTPLPTLWPWDDSRRRRAEDTVLEAERAERDGQIIIAKQLFAIAGRLEEAVARETRAPRVRSVLCVSAVALLVRAHCWREAVLVASYFLDDELVSPQARGELFALWQQASKRDEA